MEDITRDKIVGLIQSNNISANDFIWLCDQRTLDENRGKVEWSKLPPQALDMMFRTDYFKNAFINIKNYFEQKWHITKLKLPKKTIYIDSEKGKIYGG